jgi:hypothetical protein
MLTNTIVLIVVTTLAALLLAGTIAGVTQKTRTSHHHISGEIPGDKAGEDAARVHTARPRIDVRTVRAGRLPQRATVHRSVSTSSHDQLNGFGAADELRETP